MTCVLQLLLNLDESLNTFLSFLNKSRAIEILLVVFVKMLMFPNRDKAFIIVSNVCLDSNLLDVKSQNFA